MKKLTFKVSTPKEENIVSLIKEVNNINCRIQIDIENGLVIVENVNDTMIDTVIELIDKHYTLLSVDIDNIVESAVTVLQPLDNLETILESADSEKISTKTIEPKSENDLIIQKVEFKNEYVEHLINKFLRTAYWAMFKVNASEKDIGHYIWSTLNEISYRYNSETNKSIEFSVGDIVDCNYGMHLPGEVSGSHIPAIVCNISSEGMVYLVPIIKITANLSLHSYLTYTTPNDITFNSNTFSNGTVVLDMGRYICSKRFHGVIGKTSTEFLEKVLKKLATTFNFTCINVENPNPVLICNQQEVYETKSTSIETILLETLESAFDKLSSSKSVDEQLNTFLVDIGMPTDNKLLKQSFVIACDIDKITYFSIISKLHKMYPKLTEELIKASLKKSFKEWLEKYPDLAKKCPKISLMVVLKTFAKKIHN